jgi:hypothetical protein
MLRAWSFKGVRFALRMIGFAFIPVVSVALVFEFLLPKQAVALTVTSPAVVGHDLAPLFNYYVAWVAHVLISIGVGLGAARGAFKNTSPTQKAVLKRFRFVTFVIAMLAVILADAVHSNLAVLSHERIFNVLSAEPSLSLLFHYKVRIGQYRISVPTLFSCFPIGAIAAAFWTTVTIILCASKSLVEFHRAKHSKDPNKQTAAFTEALDALRSYFMALSLVLVTSTLATVAYVRTPLGLLGAAERNGFKAVTDAVGLMWGVTFSLTVLAVYIHPFIVLRDRFAELSKDAEAEVSKDEVMSRWLRKNHAFLQVPANLQLLLSMLLPATVAVLANLVST